MGESAVSCGPSARPWAWAADGGRAHARWCTPRTPCVILGGMTCLRGAGHDLGGRVAERCSMRTVMHVSGLGGKNT